jgi:hypothetical protein
VQALRARACVWCASIVCVHACVHACIAQLLVLHLQPRRASAQRRAALRAPSALGLQCVRPTPAVAERTRLHLEASSAARRRSASSSARSVRTEGVGGWAGGGSTRTWVARGARGGVSVAHVRVYRHLAEELLQLCNCHHTANTSPRVVTPPNDLLCLHTCPKLNDRQWLALGQCACRRSRAHASSAEQSRDPLVERAAAKTCQLG